MLLVLLLLLLKSQQKVHFIICSYKIDGATTGLKKFCCFKLVVVNLSVLQLISVVLIFSKAKSQFSDKKTICHRLTLTYCPNNRTNISIIRGKSEELTNIFCPTCNFF
jgi:hypothetical protein